MWEGKVFAAADADADADAAETDWKHKVTPERGDLNRCNSIANALELHPFFIKPSKWSEKYEWYFSQLSLILQLEI